MIFMSETNRIIKFMQPEGSRSSDEEEVALQEQPEGAEEAAGPEEDDDRHDSDDDDDGDGGDDGDDRDDGSEDEFSAEDFLRDKVNLAMEPGAGLAVGRAIFHEDPFDSDKLVVVMHLDKPYDEEGNLVHFPTKVDGREMWDLAMVFSFEGKGFAGPKRTISADKLRDIFSKSNWSKDRSKNKKK